MRFCASFSCCQCCLSANCHLLLTPHAAGAVPFVSKMLLTELVVAAAKGNVLQLYSLPKLERCSLGAGELNMFLNVELLRTLGN